MASGSLLGWLGVSKPSSSLIAAAGVSKASTAAVAGFTCRTLSGSAAQLAAVASAITAPVTVVTAAGVRSIVVSLPPSLLYTITHSVLYCAQQTVRCMIYTSFTLSPV